MNETGDRYLSYLLRMWQTTTDNKTIWRALLESPLTGERTGFANIRKLCDFLQAKTELSGFDQDSPQRPHVSRPHDNSKQ